MLQCLTTVIGPDMVEERHYFLETLNRPEVLWTIRAVCIAAALGALLVYAACRKKERSGKAQREEQESE